jgi:NAD(P)-dependent dehydrogenase (short-subunit alcohol dehydrogenase family)
MKRLQGKVALITGGSSGIGEGVARRFVREGATVYITARGAEAGKRVEAELRALLPGAEAHYLQADVSIQAQVQGVVEQVIERCGRLDVLVNNAQGIPPVASLMHKPDQDFRHSFESGVLATKWAMQAAFETMKAQGGGSIINVCSYWGIISPCNTGDYSANKEAIRSLTRTAANEWGRYGIRVNVIAPASESAGYRNWKAANPELAAASSAAVPLRRIGDPEHDLGSLFLGLATDETCYITGQTFAGDGGILTLNPLDAGTDVEGLDFQKKNDIAEAP